jgi:hypothetical protein
MTYVSDVTDPANGGVAATNIVVKDNVGYGPNATANSSGSAAPTMLQMIYSTSWTASGNSSDSQLKNQDPGYTATTTWAGFKLQPGSYAAGKGIRFS